MGLGQEPCRSGDYSDDRMEEAAEYFGVSVLTAKSQLANHDLIPPEMVTV